VSALAPGARLVFVYNADAGLANALLDWGHKIVSPSTYACSLCGVSYGHFGMKGEWRDFIASLGVPVTFAYRDQWTAETGEAGDPPALWIVHPDGRRERLMQRADFDACASLGAMMTRVRGVVGS
jgi:hypothetical protein